MFQGLVSTKAIVPLFNAIRLCVSHFDVDLNFYKTPTVTISEIL